MPNLVAFLSQNFVEDGRKPSKLVAIRTVRPRSEWGLFTRSAEVLHQHEVHVPLVLLRV